MLKHVIADQQSNPELGASLKILRETLNITEDVHNKLEVDIRSELSNLNENVMNEIASKDLNVMIQKPDKKPAENTISENLKNLKLKKIMILSKEKVRQRNFNIAIKLLRQGEKLAPGNKKIRILIEKSTRELNKVQKNPGVSSVPQLQAGNPAAQQAGPNTAAALSNINTGAIATQNGHNCTSCNGKGVCYWCKGSGKCDRCAGSGKVMGNKCSMCNGTGNCNSCMGKRKCMWCQGTGIQSAIKTSINDRKV